MVELSSTKFPYASSRGKPWPWWGAAEPGSRLCCTCSEPSTSTALGLFLAWLVDTYEIIRIPPDVYFVDRLPVSIHATDIFMIVGISVLIALTATIYPAIQASRLQPVNAIRHE